MLIFLLLLFGAAAMRSALASILAFVTLLLLLVSGVIWASQFTTLQLLTMLGVAVAAFYGACIVYASRIIKPELEAPLAERAARTLSGPMPPATKTGRGARRAMSGASEL